MNNLIAVLTCCKNEDRVQAIRDTWGKDLKEFDLRFFFGGSNFTWEADDCVFVDASDEYDGLPAKVKALFKWAAEKEYNSTWRVDDDVYVVEKILSRVPGASFERAHNYVGRFRSASGGYPAEYASGFCYRLSHRASSLVASTELNGDWAEDRWVGNVLCCNHMEGTQIGNLLAPLSPPLDPYTIIRTNARHSAAFCEFNPDRMREMHKWHTQVILPKLPHIPIQTTAVRLAPMTEADLMKGPTDRPDWSKQHV